MSRVHPCPELEDGSVMFTKWSRWSVAKVTAFIFLVVSCIGKQMIPIILPGVFYSICYHFTVLKVNSITARSSLGCFWAAGRSLL